MGKALRVVVNVYRKGDNTPYAKLPLRVDDEAYLSQLVEDIDAFLDEQFYAMKDDDDDE